MAPGGGVTETWLLVTAGKNGTIYLLDRDNLGHFNATTDHVVEEISGQLGRVYDTPVYFNGAVYFAAWNGRMKRFPIANGQLATTPSSIASTQYSVEGAAVVAEIHAYLADGGPNAAEKV